MLNQHALSVMVFDHDSSPKGRAKYPKVGRLALKPPQKHYEGYGGSNTPLYVL